MSATTTLVVFSHGKESSPWGTKFRQLAHVAQQHGATCLSIDYQSSELSDPEARVGLLLRTALPIHEKLVLVGSSMSGYVSTVASRTLHPAGLFLLAPAFGLAGYADHSPTPHAGRTEIVHGWHDDIVPFDNSIRFARRHDAALHLINADHRLNEALPEVVPLFERFLSALENAG